MILCPFDQKVLPDSLDSNNVICVTDVSECPVTQLRFIDTRRAGNVIAPNDYT